MPSTSVATDQTTKAINGLLNAMQQTLGALGNTFDVLGEQTLSVATLGPAVDAVIKVSSPSCVRCAAGFYLMCLQIDKARKYVQDRHAVQDAAMKSTEDGVKEQVAVAIREKLRPKVDRLVAETVARLVQDRVRDEVRTFIGFWGCLWGLTLVCVFVAAEASVPEVERRARGAPPPHPRSQDRSCQCVRSPLVAVIIVLISVCHS